jgi:hypothetical protein
MQERTIPVDTPQRRRRIQQLVGNQFPGCAAEFLSASPGALAFRVRGPTGRLRSGIITLPAHHERVRLNSAWLERQLQRAKASRRQEGRL